jgi:branched-chain amino acid transport system substrate-binding protein
LRSNIIKVAGAIAVLALGAAACGKSGNGGGGGGSSAGPVKIGIVGAATGPNAQLGINIANGAKLAIDQYNATNPKTKITAVVYDTQGDPAVAPGQVRKSIQDKVAGVVGPAFSGESKAVDKDFEEAQIPNISASATAVNLAQNGYKYWHRVVANDDVQGPADAQFITGTLKAKKVFVIDDNQEYSVGLADAVAKAAQSGGATVQRDKIDPKASDYSSTVNKVRSAGAEAIFYGGYYAEAGKLLKQLRDAGVKAKFVSDDGSSDPGLIKAAGQQQAEGAMASCPCLLAGFSKDAKAQKFAGEYKAKFGADPGTYSAEGYDAANMLIEAVKAGKTTGPDINSFLATMNYPGVSKPLKFNPNGEPTESTIFMYEVQGGTFVSLGDVKQATPK